MIGDEHELMPTRIHNRTRQVYGGRAEATEKSVNLASERELPSIMMCAAHTLIWHHYSSPPHTYEVRAYLLARRVRTFTHTAQSVCTYATAPT